MTIKTKPKIKLFNDSAFGWDGLTTFIFSNIIFLLTLGLAFFWLLFKTIKVAINSKTTLSINSPETTPAIQAILIAGLCLKNNHPIEEYQARLHRLVSLLTGVKNKPDIIILGGITGGNTLSEAQAGANYLIAHGIKAEQIILEDQSRHTLENLQNARSILNYLLQKKSSNIRQEGEILAKDVAIISSRYHLYRIVTLAQGMQMTLQPIASEKNFSFSLLMLMRMIKEAYFLHWYWSGKLWVFITANKKSKARIS